MGHDLYNNLLESGLSQHINKPTRDDNILDLTFSTNDSLVRNINTGPEFRTSDHKIVFFQSNPRGLQRKRERRAYIFIYQ